MSQSYEVKFTKKKGRGLYATKRIAAGNTIVTSSLALGKNSIGIVSRYCFDYDSKGTVAIALGDVSLANHSKDSNAECCINRSKRFPRASLIATRDIKKGEEILINYGYQPKD